MDDKQGETKFTMKQRFISVLAMIVVILSGGILSSCSSTHEHVEFSAPVPQYVSSANLQTQQAYAFAMEHPESLKFQPCYCGCNSMGHMNNLECYIKGIDANGEIVLDQHAAYCTICIDITHDVMRLEADGLSPPEIRNYIDEKYSASGPSTDTPFPAG